MNSTFDEVFSRLISHEGGFQKNPKDRGNWSTGVVGVGELIGTKYGISAMSYHRELDIPNMTLAQAKMIYLRDWWRKYRFDELPAMLRFDLFDAGVNHGMGNAARLLQKSVYAAEDGHIGNHTLAAVGKLDPCVVLARFNGHRLVFMARLSGWREFGAGWAVRIGSNLIAMPDNAP